MPSALSPLRRLALLSLLTLLSGTSGQSTFLGLPHLPGWFNASDFPLAVGPVTFDTLLFGTSTDRPFGMCNAEGQKCDWVQYFWRVWLAGLWAWVIGAAVLATLLLWMLIKCCCCCCICLAGFACSVLCCCFKECCTRTNDALIWAVRLVVLLTVGLGAAGFALSVLGWADVEVIADDLHGNYTQYVTVTLKVVSDAVTADLSNASATLGAVGTATNQSTLQGVLTPEEINAASSAQTSIAFNWTDFDGKYIAPVRDGWAYLFWVSIGVGFGTLLCTLLLGVFLHCNWFLPTLLTVTGLLACALLWAAIGVTGSGLSLMADVCSETQGILANTTTGYGLLNTLQCAQPMASNAFNPALEAAGVAGQAAAQGACGAVRQPCASGAMTCPPLPTQCTTLSQVSGLAFSITVNLNASEGGCDNACTAGECAAQCTGAALEAASEGLVECVQVASQLDTLTMNVLVPLTTCQIMQETFLKTLQYQCSVVRPACVKMIWGMFILAIASFIGAFTTLFLNEFFTGTAPTTPQI